MKRIIAFVLMFVMCLVSLTSCDILAAAFLIWAGTQEPSMDGQNEFFAPEYLIECKLEDMPVPNVDGSFRTETQIWT